MTGCELADCNGTLKCQSTEDQETGICESTNYAGVLSSRRELEKSTIYLTALNKSNDITVPERENSDSLSNDYYHRSHPDFDPNVLVCRLRLLIMSQSLGKHNHSEEISAIIQELKSARIIA